MIRVLLLVILVLSSFQLSSQATFKLGATQSTQQYAPSNIGIIGVRYLYQRGSLSNVVEVYPNTPAEKAGVQVGDMILKIDGVDLRPLTSKQVYEVMAGLPGTIATLTMLRCTSQCVTQNLQLERMEMNDISSDRIFNTYKYGF